ncbi:MAG: PEGA domain-containing protein [Calditrichaeota bacterium]|nr:MAG: PEGA domain-containing protein [Calditrichota bacterium]
MKKKFPFSYRTIQQIKAEEYQRFFSRLEGYYPYLNHLGEIVFMKENDALGQHEFFLYPETFWTRFKRRLQLRRPVELERLSRAERELRLQIRKYLEEKYIGRITTETARLLPEQFEYEIAPEELESIPITLEVFEAVDLRRFALLALLLVVVLGLGAVWFVRHLEKPVSGNLLVKTNVEGARVYLDDEGFIGYSGRVLPNVPAGEHRVRVAKYGYRPIPEEQVVSIKADSTHTVYFKLVPTTSKVSGFLKIQAPYPDSRVYIDSVYTGTVGEKPFFEVEVGQHVVNIQKSGYLTIPAVKLLNISAGDTSILVVDQIPLRESDLARRNGPAGPKTGSLEVESDVTGARIFLDGRDTGQETDFIFTELPFGDHVVEIHKEGYQADPPRQRVSLSPQSPSASVSFRLMREFERVSITVNPAQAQIFLDGKPLARGRFVGPLPLGKHILSFGDVPGYRTPRPREIQVRLREPLFLDINYFPEMRILAEVAANGSIQEKNCAVYTGYITFATRGFAASAEAGPEVVYHPVLSDFVWKLGYAFQYRDPHGNDAVKVTFQLPQHIDYEQKFTLEIQAIATREPYPFPSPRHQSEVQIRLNGQLLNPPYQPRFLEETNGLETVSWDVTRLVKPSNNSLVISVTDRNNQYFLLKRVLIYN